MRGSLSAYCILAMLGLSAKKMVQKGKRKKTCFKVECKYLEKCSYHSV